MNDRSRLQKIVAPLALGVGLTVGIYAPAEAYPDNSSIYSDYHHQQFRNIQPFRSLNVTPRYYTPLPPSRYRPSYGRHHRDRDGYYHNYDRDERRVYRKKYRNRHPHSDDYIIIRVR